MKGYPTEQAIKDAKEYLKDRLAHEISMTNNLGYYLRKAAEKVVALCESMNIPPTLFSFKYNEELSSGIDAIFHSLLEEVESACLTLATDTEKGDRNLLIPFILGVSDGLDLDGYLQHYVEQFKGEMQDYVASRLNGNKEKWSKNWKGFSHKGMSAYNSIDRLTRFAISSAWMLALFNEMQSSKAIGYYVMRGSSYPCDLCDSMVGFHPLEDEDGKPPYHANCCCIMVPVE